MYKIAILCSTTGSDIPAIQRAIRTNMIKDAKIMYIITNKSDAPVIETARELSVPYKIIEKGDRNREEYDEELIRVLEKDGIDLILLIGWMRILSKPFIDRFLGKILNIHPSLLPKYAGGMDLNVHEEVLRNGDAETGCTLHFATEEPDTGPVVVQRTVPVASNETVETLKKKVQTEEQIALVDGINAVKEKRVVFPK